MLVKKYKFCSKIKILAKNLSVEKINFGQKIQINLQKLKKKVQKFRKSQKKIKFRPKI